MDINLLSRMVCELILDNERVALPGIGTFVAVDMPASFSDRGYTINPPYRKLSVTSDREDDGLLAGLYAASNGIEKEAAALIIAKYLQDVSAELEECRSVSLPGLGKLRKTHDGSLFFVEEEGLNIDAAGFCLEPVSLKTHKEPSFQDMLDPKIISMYEPVSKPQPISEPEPEPEPEPEQEPEPEVEAEPEPQPELQPEPEPQPEQEPEPEVEPEPEPQPEVESKQELQPEIEPETSFEDGPESGHPFLKAVLWILGIALLALVILAILGRVAPEIADRLLYNAEDLRILYY